MGVYGVLSYSVSQRTQEIGVRVALGASPRNVRSLVVRDGLFVGGMGVGIGLVLAPVLTYFARSLFFRVSAFDPVSFSLVATMLLVVVVAASYLPARRATRVDPVVALRGRVARSSATYLARPPMGLRASLARPARCRR